MSTGPANATSVIARADIGQFIASRARGSPPRQTTNQTVGNTTETMQPKTITALKGLMRLRLRHSSVAATAAAKKPATGASASIACSYANKNPATTSIHAELPSAPPSQELAFH